MFFFRRSIFALNYLRIEVSRADPAVVPGRAGVLGVWGVGGSVVGVTLAVEDVVLRGVTLLVDEQVRGDLAGAVPGDLLGALLVGVVPAVLALDTLERRKEEEKCYSN